MPAALPTAPFVMFDRTGSTSTLLLDWAQAAPALPSGTTVVARAQSAARGSRGRGWVSPVGNFAASVLLRPGLGAGDAEAANAGRLALVGAVALTDALARLVGPVPGLRVKWPNDVTVGGAKLAGILVDAVTDGRRLRAAVIGIGVNVARAPDVPGRATCALAGLGLGTPDPAVFAAALRTALLALARAPFADILAAWCARAEPEGAPLRVRSQGRVREGAFAGLSPAGHLLLREPGGIATIAAGDVLWPGDA